jgi:hypothetical protein
MSGVPVNEVKAACIASTSTIADSPMAGQMIICESR